MTRERKDCADGMPGWKRWSLILAGTFSLAAGIVGIVVPILPTTPFLLLTAACYARSSQRFYCWLIGNRLFGAYIRNYREGRGLPWGIKVFTIIMLWTTISLSAFAFLQEWWVRVILLAVALAVTAHVVMIRPRGP